MPCSIQCAFQMTDALLWFYVITSCTYYMYRSTGFCKFRQSFEVKN
uniref:Uncharacterized protein n=1 Tax=Arundo donax TaxID=35708 RepID=A0A0A8XN17_ARUDO